MSSFVYDRILDARDICNFKSEISRLRKHVANHDCVRLYGLRNFGKTSILKSVIGTEWVQHRNHIFMYVDLYSVQSLDDLSLELSLALNRAMSGHGNLIDLIKKMGKTLKGIRPTWRPSDSEFGEFSFTTSTDDKTPTFDLILENIGRMQQDGPLRFLLVFDEFQEIAKIRRAEAKFRGALQNLPAAIPVVISGSKFHLLQKLFDDPKAPFHQWGVTIELPFIDYHVYHDYITDRLQPAGKTIDLVASTYIQDKMYRIPESINRLCEFLRIDPTISNIDQGVVDRKILEYVDLARSNYASLLSRFTPKENKILTAIAKQQRVSQVTGAAFLRLTDQSKSGVHATINRLLDQSVIYRFDDQNHQTYFQLADPLLATFLSHYR